MYWEQGLDPSGELLDTLWRGLQPGLEKQPAGRPQTE
jgi:hypothetical protein